MGIVKGGALRLFQTALYAIIFLCAAIVLGFYSYFLSVLADRSDTIPTWEKAVEGISGAAVLYLIFAVLLTCCLGGIAFLAFLAIFLDICFVGGMLAIAVLTRHGASSCKGTVNTPLGTGSASSSTGGFGTSGFGDISNDSSNVTYSVSLGHACRYNTAVFACSIIAAFLFLCTAALQVALVRHHKKEKRFGPSPSNNYTSGTGRRRGLFARKNKNAEKEAELGAAGVGAGTLAANHHNDTRPSHETGYTGSTVAAPGNTGNVYDKVENQQTGHMPHGTHGGYYTQPQGTGVNPYGYESNATHPAGTATNY